MRRATVGVCPVTRAHAIVLCTVSGRAVAEYRCANPSDADTIAHTFMCVGAAGAADVYRTIYADKTPELPTIH